MHSYYSAQNQPYGKSQYTLFVAEIVSLTNEILYNNYLNGTLAAGLRENFDADFRVKHFEEQLFTGYDIAEFEQLFEGCPVEHVTTAAVDGILELAKGRSDFQMSDDEFRHYAAYHLATCEKRELLGCSSHLLYIGRKKS